MKEAVWSGVQVRRAELVREVEERLEAAQAQAKDRAGVPIERKHGGKGFAPFKGKTAHFLADKLGVSTRTVERIIQVLKSGNEEVINKLRSGEYTCNHAVEVITGQLGASEPYNYKLRKRVEELENYIINVGCLTIDKEERCGNCLACDLLKAKETEND
jgi:hypothetical protein